MEEQYEKFKDMYQRMQEKLGPVIEKFDKDKQENIRKVMMYAATEYSRD